MNNGNLNDKISRETLQSPYEYISSLFYFYDSNKAK